MELWTKQKGDRHGRRYEHMLVSIDRPFLCVHVAKRPHYGMLSFILDEEDLLLTDSQLREKAVTVVDSMLLLSDGKLWK